MLLGKIINFGQLFAAVLAVVSKKPGEADMEHSNSKMLSIVVF